MAIMNAKPAGRVETGSLYVLLVLDDDELHEIVGPFTTRSAAAKFREGIEAERCQVVALRDPHQPQSV